MDQREEWRSLYSVVCPRCESISEADDLSCPYCGADRHGAVLTRARADASLAVIDDALRAMVRAASSRVSDASSIGADDSGPSPQDAESGSSFPSSRIPLFAVMAVGVCIVLAAFGWIRTASDEGAGRLKADAMDAARIVRKLVAPAAASAQPGSTKTTGPVEHEGSLALAQDRFYAMASPMSRAAFGVHGLPQASPCSVTARPASVFDAQWCDISSSMQGALAGGSATDRAGTTVLQTAGKAPRDNIGIATPTEMSARSHSSYVSAPASQRVARAQSAPKPVSQVAGTKKVHPDTHVSQHAKAPVRKKTQSTGGKPVPTIRADASLTNKARSQAR
jgi:hypothetical protein